MLMFTYRKDTLALFQFPCKEGTFQHHCVFRLIHFDSHVSRYREEFRQSQLEQSDDRLHFVSTAPQNQELTEVSVLINTKMRDKCILECVPISSLQAFRTPREAEYYFSHV